MLSIISFNFFIILLIIVFFIGIEFGRIDIGCYMFKTNMGKKITLDTTYAQSDWKFIEDYFKKYPVAKVGKVNKVLYVHN